jgi:hypothetical protein
MNEQIEEIYTRMFSPQPIPEAVVEMFDKTNFYLNRIDAPVMRLANLALIAAIATTSTEQAAVPTPKLPDTIDTKEPEEPVETITPQIDAGMAPGIPTGPMDAPITQTQGTPKTDLQMQHMNATELKAHAKEFYKKDWPLRMGKKQMIVALKALNKARAAR